MNYSTNCALQKTTTKKRGLGNLKSEPRQSGSKSGAVLKQEQEARGCDLNMVKGTHLYLSIHYIMYPGFVFISTRRFKLISEVAIYGISSILLAEYQLIINRKQNISQIFWPEVVNLIKSGCLIFTYVPSSCIRSE